ncbi:MAG: DNA mismatch repair endonuclease MutL [Clostridia bacterium]|nr:DNA mismatch repair endonuclease MutL [Clostridia bacterium]
MGNIVLLDDLTINKIAAGEVIERPASVIKEMVENSIDAGANNITVEIKNGGISYIKVTDNGKGIVPDDLEIAFERHATSKIRKAEDLDIVTSMGFRGEALASIAAIANVEMVSKTQSQDIGYKIVVEAGNVLNKEEVGCQTGTSITVKNLFFNTPVRYKFLKKDYTESGYIEDAITRIALVHPEIAIKLINTGKTIIQTNGNGDIKSVIYSIYGKDVANGIVPVEYTYEYIKVIGVIGKPEIARSNRANQIFFVNKRYVKDKTLSAATEQAFKGLIPIGKFGFVILNLDMEPSKVDVNVHPAKLEVRFQEENKVFQSIYHAIKDVLLKSELVANTERTEILENSEELTGLFDFRKNETEKIKKYNDEEYNIKTNISKVENDKKNIKPNTLNVGQGGPINTEDILQQLRKLKQNLEDSIEDTESKEKEEKTEEKQILQEITPKEPNIAETKETETKEDIKETEETSQEVSKETEVQASEVQKEELQSKINIVQEEINKLENMEYDKQPAEEFNSMYEKLFGTKPIEEIAEENKEENKEENTAIDILKDNISVFEESTQYERPTYKFTGIVFNTYIIIEIDNEMYIIDQHAAHERIMYEKVKENYYSESTKDSQMLLLPDIITLTHKEMEIAKDNMDLFKNAGFELEEFGENTIKLTGVPTVCIDIDTKSLFLETLDEINTVARTAKQEKEEKFIATVACKAAVKANMVLEKAEVESLMDKLLKLPNPFTCPHGRPTAIKMSKYDIERKFARK